MAQTLPASLPTDSNGDHASRSAVGEATPNGNRPAAVAAGDRITMMMTSALFFASGFAALSYQVAWQRALFGWYGVDMDSVSAIVSIFMLGLGVGALVGGWMADRWPTKRLLTFSIIEGLIALFGFFSLDIIDGAGALFYNLPLPIIVGVTFLVFLVPTCAMGATLPVLVTELTSRTGNVGASTGQLYYINTLGAAIGALAVAYVLLPWGGLDGAVRVAALINLAISVTAALTLNRSVAAMLRAPAPGAAS